MLLGGKGDGLLQIRDEIPAGRMAYLRDGEKVLSLRRDITAELQGALARLGDGATFDSK
jgi:hypothetical protein